MFCKNTLLYTGLSIVLCCFQTNAQNTVAPPNIQEGYIQSTSYGATYGLAMYSMPNGNLMFESGNVVDDTGAVLNGYDLYDDTVLGFTGISESNLGIRSIDVKLLSDGSFIVRATTRTPITITANNQTLTPQGGNDILIVKYDSSFNLQWAKLYGGSAKDGANDIIQTADGGYILVGNTQSTDGDLQGIKTAANTINHIYIAKLDATGAILWQKTYGGTQTAATINARYIGQEVIQTSDGNYLVRASLNGTADGDITETALGGSDVWMLKLNSTDGTILWQKLLGGSNTDTGKRIKELNDGDYAVLVKSKSVDGQVTYPKGEYDAWLVKLDKTNGNIQWETSIGGVKDEGSDVMDFTIAPEGNIVVGTTTNSDELTGFQGAGTGTTSNILISKIDYLNGDVIWERSFGPTGQVGGSAFNNIYSYTNGNLLVFGRLSRDPQANPVQPFSGPDVDTAFTQHNYTDSDSYIDWIFKLEACPEYIYEPDIILCEGKSYDFYGTIITEPGTYTHTISGGADSGCDQVVNLTVEMDTLEPPVIVEENGVLSTEGEYEAYQWLKDGESIAGATEPTYTPTKTGNYQVEVTNENGCSKISDGYLDTDRYEVFGNVKIYPNPTKDVVHIEIPQLDGKAELSLVNMNGRVIDARPVLDQQAQISLKGLADGIYFIRISTDKATVVKKVVKK